MKISAKRENVCANISAQNVLKADISSKQSFDILFGQPAQIDVKAAVKYIKSGQKEIDDYVQTSLESAISSKQDVIEDLENIRTGANLGISSVQPADLDISLRQKQETLVSGTNIKTINNQSLLGFGNISISGGVDSVNGKTGTVVLSTSDLTNDSGYVTGSSLATVATSGDYDDLINTPTVYHPDLLSFQWSDHLLNNVSWLRADTFSWQDGTVYEAAYQHLVADYNGGTSTTETIGSNTITVYTATDGHKIVLEDQAQRVQDIYDETGIAWYFILDTTNRRFKLPRTKFGFTGFRDSVGKYVEAGLPNIIGTTESGSYWHSSTTDDSTGPFYRNYKYGANVAGSVNQNYSGTLNFDASRSSSIYGNSTTVQPSATEMYLYFYVGDYTQTALEQTAGLNAELFNNKADISAVWTPEITTQQQKETIINWGMPDYTAGITISTGSYTPQIDGLIRVSGGNNNTNKYIDVNGARAASAYVNSTTSTDIIAFVQKGDTIAIIGTGVDVYFYPLKGAN